MLTRSLISAAILLAATAGTVRAQEAPPVAPAPEVPANRDMDWVLTEIPGRKAIVAMAQFDNGLTLTTRCVDGVFEALLHGLPEVRGLTRELQITLGEGTPYESSWITGEDSSTAFSRVPVRLARGLAQGGQLQIRVPAYRGNRPIRYILDLPPSVSAVEQTLTACGKSMVDLRYDTMADENSPGLPLGTTWAEEPKFSFPPSARPMIAVVGYVTVSCGVTEALSPRDCLIESEYPAGYGFGREVLRKVERSQLRLTTPDAPFDRQSTILFNINFRLQ